MLLMILHRGYLLSDFTTTNMLNYVSLKSGLTEKEDALFGDVQRQILSTFQGGQNKYDFCLLTQI